MSRRNLPSATASGEASGVHSLNSSAPRADEKIETTRNAPTARERENFTEPACLETGNIQGEAPGVRRAAHPPAWSRYQAEEIRAKKSPQNTQNTQQRKPDYNSPPTESGAHHPSAVSVSSAYSVVLKLEN